MKITKANFSSLLFILSHSTLSGAAPASTTSAAAPFPTGPLEEFHSNFFNGLFITTNETLFSETYDTGYSPDLVENGNGVAFTFETFKPFLEQERALFTDRALVSSVFAIVPDDATGLTGNVGHMAVVSANLNGSAVLATVVAVLNTGLNSEGEQVNTAERFVLAVEPAK